MAREVITQVIVSDDLDGTQGDNIESIKFAYKGTAYVIDLTPGHVAEFDKAIEKFLKAAHVDKETKSAAARPAQGNPEAALIREWAKANGLDLPNRGRIHGDVTHAYHQGKVTDNLRQRFGFPEAQESAKADSKADAKTDSKAAAKK